MLLTRHISSEGGRLLLKRLQFLREETLADECDVMQLDNGAQVYLERVESPRVGNRSKPRTGVGSASPRENNLTRTKTLNRAGGVLGSGVRGGEPGIGAQNVSASGGGVRGGAGSSGLRGGAGANEEAGGGRWRGYKVTPRELTDPGFFQGLLGACASGPTLKVIVSMSSFGDGVDATESVYRALTESGVENVCCLPLSSGGGSMDWLQCAMAFIPDLVEQQCPARSPHSPTVMLDVPVGVSASRKMGVIPGFAAIGTQLRVGNYLESGSSYGLGQIIRQLAEQGMQSIQIGLPADAATFDCGVGLAQALGVRFYDGANNEIPTKGGVDGLERITSVDLSTLDPVLTNVKISLGCETMIPLTGEVNVIDKLPTEAYKMRVQTGVSHLTAVMSIAAQNSTAHILPGSGCAGGIGYMLALLLECDIKPGVELLVSNNANLSRRISAADLLITGGRDVPLATQLVALAGKQKVRAIVYTDDVQKMSMDRLGAAIPVSHVEPQLDLQKQVQRTVKLLRLGKRVEV